jgi:hypothetical protein
LVEAAGTGWFSGTFFYLSYAGGPFGSTFDLSVFYAATYYWGLASVAFGSTFGLTSLAFGSTFGFST